MRRGACSRLGAILSRDSATALKVGALVILTSVVGYVAYRQVDERSGSASGRKAYALLDNAQGLVPKSRVMIAGIPVGTIERIHLWQGRARVDLSINDEVTLYDDASIEKRSGSVLGESFLAISPGTEGLAPLPPGSEIKNVLPATGVDALLDDFKVTSKNIREITNQLQGAFGTERAGAQMAQSLESLTSALQAIERTIAQNEAVVTEAIESVRDTTSAAGPRLVAVLESVQRSSENIERLLAQNSGSLDTALGTAGETAESLRSAAASLDEALTDVKAITKATAEGKGTIGRLTQDEDVADDVEATVDDISEFVGSISRLQTIIGLRTEYNLLSGDFKSYFSLRIQPREDRYYLVQIVDDPRGFLEEVTTEVETNPPPDGVPASYTERRTITRDRFRFSLMMAQRISFLTLRFGILESSGGLGIDTHLLRDALELSTDLFGFGENDLPRVRLRLAYEILNKFWLVTGVDDVLNDTNDIFVGAMLRFNDEDLKSILPFVGGSVSGQ